MQYSVVAVGVDGKPESVLVCGADLGYCERVASDRHAAGLGEACVVPMMHACAWYGERRSQRGNTTETMTPLCNENRSRSDAGMPNNSLGFA